MVGDFAPEELLKWAREEARSTLGKRYAADWHDEVAQEAVVRFLKNPPGDRDKGRPYLKRIVQNLWRDRYRRLRAGRDLVADDPVDLADRHDRGRAAAAWEQPDGPLRRAELHDVIQMCLERLDAATRSLVRKALDGMPILQLVADALEIGVEHFDRSNPDHRRRYDALQKRIRRGREAVRECVEEHWGGVA